MKSSHAFVRSLLPLLVLIAVPVFGQVNSGSDGHDGVLAPTADLVIDMADHPDGIYHYASVNIPSGVNVTFIPNAGNRPVVWLVQGDCVIAGRVSLSGQSWDGISGPGSGGPGGFPGGNGGTAATRGGGPGGGSVATFGAKNSLYPSGGGAYATVGTSSQIGFGAPGQTYGNRYAVPLVGGSGGGGSLSEGLPPDGIPNMGAGGGGAILLAVSGTLSIAGNITADGGSGVARSPEPYGYGGPGSGGAIRLVVSNINGGGTLSTSGGTQVFGQYWSIAGEGRIRIDAIQNQFNGQISGSYSIGYQPIILPAANQGIQLAITSVGGVAVPANPSGTQAKPDVTIPGQQSNPVTIAVKCTNVPLNTEITVVVQPATGSPVQAVALNKTGTLASSTATVSLNLPRGAGTIYAKAVTGLASTAAVSGKVDKTKNIAQTGWTADGETFAQVEVKAELGGASRLTYITESGKRYALPQ